MITVIHGQPYLPTSVSIRPEQLPGGKCHYMIHAHVSGRENKERNKLDHFNVQNTGSQSVVPFRFNLFYSVLLYVICSKGRPTDPSRLHPQEKNKATTYVDQMRTKEDAKQDIKTTIGITKLNK